MCQIRIFWSDRLENLAQLLFERKTTGGDPFERECTVVGSPVMEGWLKQYFLYDFPRAHRKQTVLANWEFRQLHPFVNDWLAKACEDTPIGKRKPAQHPYSKGVMQWRIWNELQSPRNEPDAYKILRDYVGTDAGASDRRRWGLAGKLSHIFDDYQNYRPAMLQEWLNGQAPLDEDHWQGEMWRRLVTDKKDTYLSQFKTVLEKPDKLNGCGIGAAYRRLTIFGVTGMPQSYMQFFVALGKLMDVQMFVFNPSRQFWIEAPTVKQHMKQLGQNADQLAWMTPPHPLLSGFGRGSQAFLAAILDSTDGNVNESRWGADSRQSFLTRVQAHVRNDEPGHLDSTGKDDGSIQAHVCHSPLREAEVVKDLILKWFDENKQSQPRDVQVLVPDLETYAPFIEAVFQVNDHNPSIPCVISKRPPVSAGAIGTAFVQLLRLNERRMTAPEVMELLELDPVRERYGLSVDDVMLMRKIVGSAGIRWGKDAKQVDELGLSSMSDIVTWRRGLDRLLAGMAVGRLPAGSELIAAGELGPLLACDEVEGHTAELVGKLGQFFEDLCETADAMQGSVPVSVWSDRLTGLLERFFTGTESSFMDLAEIRRGIKAIGNAAQTAGDPAVSVDVMAPAMEAQLGGMAPSGNCAANAVLFSPMQTMQATPRKMIVMMGLNEGVYPRADNRTAFDRIGQKARFGDRSLRYEDRLAFLEGLMGARERLILTYTGRSNANNEPVPPSPVVTEFLQYLGEDHEGKGADGVQRFVVEHKLHGFNPAYYAKEGALAPDVDSRLFSYSQSNFKAAQAVTDPGDGSRLDQPTVSVETASCPDVGEKIVSLEELQEFFVNPARHLHVKVLQMRLRKPGKDGLEDSEAFELDELDQYNLNQLLVRQELGRAQTLPADADKTMTVNLRERAMIPLGRAGEEMVNEQIAVIRSFLDKPSNTLLMPMRDVLNRIEQAASQQLEFSAGAFKVQGSLRLSEFGSGPHMVCFRYAKLKAKDRIRAWVAHVWGHAVDRSPVALFSTVLISKDGEVVLPSLERGKAVEIMKPLLELYAAGCRGVLPFAPESSLAYAGFMRMQPAERKKATGVDMSLKELAMNAAEGKWNSVIFPEMNDEDMNEAWKEEGPMKNDQFGETALKFWGPILDCLGEAGVAGGNGEDEDEDDHE
jgi:exodeoxyribonuclease V gamma subunit